jgi:hypothetical protein
MYSSLRVFYLHGIPQHSVSEFSCYPDSQCAIVLLYPRSPKSSLLTNIHAMKITFSCFLSCCYAKDDLVGFHTIWPNVFGSTFRRKLWKINMIVLYIVSIGLYGNLKLYFFLKKSQLLFLNVWYLSGSVQVLFPVPFPQFCFAEILVSLPHNRYILSSVRSEHLPEINSHSEDRGSSSFETPKQTRY